LTYTWGWNNILSLFHKTNGYIGASILTYEPRSNRYFNY